MILLDLTQIRDGQGDLWERPDTAKSRRLMQAIDLLNADYGRGTVVYASSGYTKAWKLRSDFVSPRYTTSWWELLKVDELKGAVVGDSRRHSNFPVDSNDANHQTGLRSSSLFR